MLCKPNTNFEMRFTDCLFKKWIVKINTIEKLVNFYDAFNPEKTKECWRFSRFNNNYISTKDCAAYIVKKELKRRKLI